MAIRIPSIIRTTGAFCALNADKGSAVLDQLMTRVAEGGATVAGSSSYLKAVK